MNYTKRNLIAIVFILIAAIAAGIWVAVSGWPPITIRDRHYRELIRDFQRATHRDRIQPGDDNAGWDFEVQILERQTTARVRAVAHMGVARVKYGDEDDERVLYKSVDYSHPEEIRTMGNVLYVYWTENLVRTDHWILAYDLADRREVAKRRIDPGDIGKNG